MFDVARNREAEERHCLLAMDQSDHSTLAAFLQVVERLRALGGFERFRQYLFGGLAEHQFQLLTQIDRHVLQV